MATSSRESSTPSFFNFLKEGLLLPTHNPRLFAAVFAIIVASSSLLLLGNDLAVQPLVDKIRIDSNALNSTNASSPEFLNLLHDIQDDTRAIFITGTLCTLVAAVIGSFIKITVLFAAVTSYSGELHTFASLLNKVKAQLKGPLLTLGFVYVLETTYLVLIVGMVAFLTIVFVMTMTKHYLAMLLIDSLLIVAASIFFAYFSIILSLSTVVAVAEPGCHGAGAVVKAWRLMKGKRWRAILLIVVTGVPATAFSPVHTLAKTYALSNIASGLLLGFLYTILMGALGLFATCAMTAFYYECKGSTETSATEYIKVSTEDQKTNV
ncbi:hypothetical protein HU200_060303 [Digitaria exilis]|uniref:Transmembrane protein n=1 Tax=Digitaria exilis TaxID=1010633 RepID=A0A835AAW8_9POAL|nr:hypothetical protein HU200_060303 [Digitaria exilis]